MCYLLKKFNYKLLAASMYRTVWKFEDFSDIQILREINFEESRIS